MKKLITIILEKFYLCDYDYFYYNNNNIFNYNINNNSNCNYNNKYNNNRNMTKKLFWCNGYRFFHAYASSSLPQCTLSKISLK